MKESNPLIVTVQKPGPDCNPSTAGLENEEGFFSLVLIWPSENAASRFYLETFFGSDQDVTKSPLSKPKLPDCRFYRIQLEWY